MMHVLHITGWFPNHLVPHETPFIDRHISALAPHCDNSTWHIDTRPGARWTFTRSGPKAHRTFLVTTPLSRWFIIEWISTLLILWSWLTRDRSKPVDLVNFHIAYPNCTRIRLLRWVMRRPMVITEHWSIYHFSFKSAAKGLDRVRAIFHVGVPLIVVSTALEEDIARFAGPPRPETHIVDNAVDPEVFNYRSDVAPRVGVFFTIAGWRSPKRPEVLLEAMAIMRKNGLIAQLRIAGIGPKLPAIRDRVTTLGLEDQVEFLGQLGPEDVANEMRRAHALVHSSDYETYSAVCAEALCCGTPVIASEVGGVPGLVLPDRGALVPENSGEVWARAWSRAWTDVLRMDRAKFARSMTERVNSRSVGERYFQILTDVAQHFRSSDPTRHGSK